MQRLEGDAKKLFVETINDSKALLKKFQKTSVYRKYTYSTELPSFIPWMSILLLAFFKEPLSVRLGADEAFIIENVCIATISEQLPSGKYKNNGEGLFEFFLEIGKKLYEISDVAKTDEADPYYYAAIFSLELIYGVEKNISVDIYEDFLNEIAFFFKVSNLTIADRILNYDLWEMMQRRDREKALKNFYMRVRPVY